MSVDKEKITRRKLFGTLLAVGGATIALVLAACTFSITPLNSVSPQKPGGSGGYVGADSGTIEVINDANSPFTLTAVRIYDFAERNFSQYPLDGLAPGSTYILPSVHAPETYKVKFHNGLGWTRIAQNVSALKDQTVSVTYMGNEEIDIDLSGTKGKLAVNNLITDPAYVIKSIRVSSVEENGREVLIFYFYDLTIGKGESPEFDVLPGQYWVRAKIMQPNGAVSKWSKPAQVYDSSTKTISEEPGQVTVSSGSGGVAVFTDKILVGGNSPGDVLIEDPNDFPDNQDPADVNGGIGGSKDVKAIKVEKLGFTTYDRNGVTTNPVYQWDERSSIVENGKPVAGKSKVVTTTIFEQTPPLQPGSTWRLALSEEGWYLLSFSENGETFSKAYPIRLSKDANGEWVVEPPFIPPYDGDDPTWSDKAGVIVSNDTPAAGGPIVLPDGSSGGTLSPEDAVKPITNIKIYDTKGNLVRHYHEEYGLPIYNDRSWLIPELTTGSNFPSLPPGDYLATISDDNGATWTDPPYPFHVDGDGNGEIHYNKTRPWWTGKIAGKPDPGKLPDQPYDDKTKNEAGDDSVWVQVPADPPLDTVPPGNGPKELQDATGTSDEDTTPTVPGSQLDIVNRSVKGFKISYIKLNTVTAPRKAYRVIDLTKITYTGGSGGIPAGKRLSLVGFDLKPALYYVYLSQNGKDWKRYEYQVKIPAPWTYDSAAKKVELNKEVEKVIYIDKDDDPGKDHWKDDDSDLDSPDNGGGDGDKEGDGGDDNPGENGDGNDNTAIKTGFLRIRNNHATNNITGLTVNTPAGLVLVYDGDTYANYPISAPHGEALLVVLPITAGNDKYQVRLYVNNVATPVAKVYPVKIAENKYTTLTYIDGSTNDPDPGEPTDTLPDDGGGGSGNPDDRPPSGDNNTTVIGGGGGIYGPMQPGTDPTDDPNFDITYASIGDMEYPSGRVLPYVPYPTDPLVSVPFPEGGNGTKKNMDSRGYFNFRHHWRADSNWGIGYIALKQKSTGKTIILLDAKAPVTDTAAMSNGTGQAKLGDIFRNGVGSAVGKDRSFLEWQANWLGLKNANGWQVNINGSGLDPNQPVYRSGKGYYKDDTSDWSGSVENNANERRGAHRAKVNPGRLYTTGVWANADGSPGTVYAPLGTGFEAGDYTVILYKGYDSLYKTSTTTSTGHNLPIRQKKMYRYYEESFAISIYPGVITTSVYRDNNYPGVGAAPYTPIPQAAFAKLVVMNTDTKYTVNAILLDKPGRKSDIDYSGTNEIHRYQAALKVPSINAPSRITGVSWTSMDALLNGQSHTFILPPGGYRIAVQSTRSNSYLYGASADDWTPVLITEGETVYLKYKDTKLAR